MAEHTVDNLRTFCRGVLHAIGMFDPAGMTEEERAADPARTWFCLGETCMAALLAANIAVPAFFRFAGMTALPLACIGAAVLFLPLFVFLPKVIRSAMRAETDAVLEAPDTESPSWVITDIPCPVSRSATSSRTRDTPSGISRMPLSCRGTGAGIPAPGQVPLQNTTG